MDKSQLEITGQTISTLRTVLKDQKKQRGYRKPIYRKDKAGNRVVEHYARHHSDVLAGQIMQLANAAEPEHQVVKDVQMGCLDLDPETHVVIYTDDLYVLLDHADAAIVKFTPPPAAPVTAAPVEQAQTPAAPATEPSTVS